MVEGGSDCFGAELVFLALKEARCGEQADDVAESWVGAVHELAAMPAACQSRFSQGAPVDVFHRLRVLKESEGRFASMLIRHHQHHAARREQVTASVMRIVFPHRRIRRQRHALQPLVLDGESGREPTCEPPPLRRVERRVENERGFETHALRFLFHSIQEFGQFLRAGRRGGRESVVVAEAHKSGGKMITQPPRCCPHNLRPLHANAGLARLIAVKLMVRQFTRLEAVPRLGRERFEMFRPAAAT